MRLTRYKKGLNTNLTEIATVRCPARWTVRARPLRRRRLAGEMRCVQLPGFTSQHCRVTGRLSVFVSALHREEPQSTHPTGQLEVKTSRRLWSTWRTAGWIKMRMSETHPAPHAYWPHAPVTEPCAGPVAHGGGAAAWEGCGEMGLAGPRWVGQGSGCLFTDEEIQASEERVKPLCQGQLLPGILGPRPSRTGGGRGDSQAWVPHSWTSDASPRRGRRPLHSSSRRWKFRTKGSGLREHGTLRANLGTWPPEGFPRALPRLLPP